MYAIKSGIAQHLQHPDTFHIPSQEQKNDLAVGDLVKLTFVGPEDVERMWVEILRIDGGILSGALDSHPLCIDAECGDLVTFTFDDIIDIAPKPTIASKAADFREAIEAGGVGAIPSQILDMRLPDTRIAVNAWGGGYGIYWHGYGPNEWTAWFPALSTALAFVAALARCAEADWKRSFAVTLCEEFDAAATRFLSEVTA